jgi:hypothetical protein
MNGRLRLAMRNNGCLVADNGSMDDSQRLASTPGLG